MNTDSYSIGFLGLFVLITGISLRLAIPLILYHKTSYYQNTRLPYFTMLHDIGRYGEYETYRVLRSFEKRGARFLFNVYLPKGNGETTEIDVLMIDRNGIFVFESKNYSGWIFGEEKQNSWTQILPRGRGRRAQKQKFLNPVWQNKLHISALEHLLADRQVNLFSLIVFSNRCELKNVKIYSNNVRIIHRRDLMSAVNQCESHYGLSDEKITDLYRFLLPFSQRTEEEKKNHIETIWKSTNRAVAGTKETPQKKATPFSEVMSSQKTKVCPRCGAALVLRTAKRGNNSGNQFYGCSNYPICRHIEPVNHQSSSLGDK